MDREPTHAELRSARRFALAVRAFVYGSLAVAAAFVLVVRFAGAGDAGAGVRHTLDGSTSQGERFSLVLVGEGRRPDHFVTRLRLDGCHIAGWWARWSPAHEMPVPFVVGEGGFTVREEAGDLDEHGQRHAVYTLEGTVAPDGRSAEGRMRVHQTLRRKDGTVNRCTSGEVAWRVSAGGPSTG